MSDARLVQMIAREMGRTAETILKREIDAGNINVKEAIGITLKSTIDLCAKNAVSFAATVGFTKERREKACEDAREATINELNMRIDRAKQSMERVVETIDAIKATGRDPRQVAEELYNDQTNDTRPKH